MHCSFNRKTFLFISSEQLQLNIFVLVHGA